MVSKIGNMYIQLRCGESGVRNCDIPPHFKEWRTYSEIVRPCAPPKNLTGTLPLFKAQR